MRWILTAFAVLTLAGTAAAQGRLEPFQLLRLDRAAFRAGPVAMFPVDERSGVQMVYGDRFGLVRVVRVTESGVTEIFRSRPQAGQIAEILLADLDGNDSQEIVSRTSEGNILVIEADPFSGSFNERWDSINDGVRPVSAMAIANVDNDPNYELIMLSQEQLLFYDGAAFTREFQSTQTYRAGVREIYVGYVDSDPEPEIVFNNGVVVDAITGEPEWETEPFGSQIELIDIDGDGLQEVLGYSSSTTSMRIFDVDAQEEKPLQ